jgi:hypothetical protein
MDLNTAMANVFRMKTSTLLFTITISFFVVSSLGCGGSSGADGSIIHGRLTQLSAGAHGEESDSAKISSADQLQLRHSEGQDIDGVKICLLGECSLTDSDGEWGVNVSEIPAGDILLTAQGHGIDSSVIINVPAGAGDVTVDLGNSAEGISVTALVVDGEDHTEHDHDHAG